LFSGNIDTTGVQLLVDTRKELEKWRDGPVEIHFANILSPWVRRGLVAGGFGTGEDTSPVEVAPVVPPQNEDFADPTPGPEWKYDRGAHKRPAKTGDVESSAGDDASGGKEGLETSTHGPLVSTLTPFIHVDLPAAVASAERGVKRDST
jgi:solute carrier family 26 (sodium-independent sulfate anion transporter), member 11